MKYSIFLYASFLVSLLVLNSPSKAASSKDAYKISYTVGFIPSRKIAKVEIEIKQDAHVSLIDFNLDGSQCYKFSSKDTLERSGGRLLWYPNKLNGKLSYQCKINHRRPGRTNRAYDAYATKHWAIFRGDDLVPAAHVRSKSGAYSKAELLFDLPDSWPSVNTGWEPASTDATSSARFLIDNPQRRFDRPTGWMIAGNLGTRRSTLDSTNAQTRVSVSAPLGSEFRRMDILAFINLLWPEFESAFGISNEHILILGADDPMWRGGLSAGNSFYIHGSRPLISENGTSTLAHELFHMLTGIQGTKNNDWIAEGLAEYYSVELLHRAGATNEDRRQSTIEKLTEWSKNVDTVFKLNSKGKTTAKAAVLFNLLNEEIKTKTNAHDSIDSITRLLVEQSQKNKKVSFADLKKAYKRVTGTESNILDSL